MWTWFDELITGRQLSLTDVIKEVSLTYVETHKDLEYTVYEVQQSLTYLFTVIFLIERFYPKIQYLILRKDLDNILSRIIHKDEIKTTKVIKYYFSAICSIAYASSDLPVRPDFMKSKRLFPFGAVPYKALYRRLKKGGGRAISFCSSLFLARYASVIVTPAFIESSSKSYKERLVKVPAEREYNHDAIKLAVKQLGGKYSFEKFCASTVKCLSVSSVSEKSAHGQYGVINDFGPKVSFDTPVWKYEGICPSPYFGYSFDMLMTGNATHLCEPLKVRSITTASAFEFLAGKPFQDVFSKRMKRCENMCFGREVSETDINLLIHRSKKYFGDNTNNMYFLSGDYESATDNLNPKLSRIVDNYMVESLGLDFSIPSDSDVAKRLWFIMAKIFEYMKPEGPSCTKRNWINVNLYIKLMFERSALGKKTVLSVRDTLWSGRLIQDKVSSPQPFIQTMGQLMGDIKSFPVLCVINLALWNHVNSNRRQSRMVCSEIPLLDVKTFEKEFIDPPCLINGDDFLAYAPKEIVDKWFELVVEFDLKASIGKTYVSKKVAQINSTNFMKLPDDTVRKVKSIPVHAIMQIPSDRPVTQSINYAIEYDKDNFLFNRLIFYNKQRIKDVTRNGLVNLCLPVCAGGLGVKAEPKNITARQYCIAWHNARVDPSKRIEAKFEWLPFNKKMRNNKVEKIIIQKHKPKGIGVMVDKFGLEHVMSSYNLKKNYRGMATDDWTSCMSRQRYKDKSGYMKIRKDFYNRFAKISTSLIKDRENWKDRVPNIIENEMKSFGRYRKVLGNHLEFGNLRILPQKSFNSVIQPGWCSYFLSSIWDEK
jgi:hypothetical protein